MKLGEIASQVRSRSSQYRANGWVQKYVQGAPHRQSSVWLRKCRLRSEYVKSRTLNDVPDRVSLFVIEIKESRGM